MCVCVKPTCVGNDGSMIRKSLRGNPSSLANCCFNTCTVYTFPALSTRIAGKDISGRLLLTAFAIEVTLDAPIPAAAAAEEVLAVVVVVVDGIVPFCKENIDRNWVLSTSIVVQYRNRVR